MSQVLCLTAQKSEGLGVICSGKMNLALRDAFLEKYGTWNEDRHIVGNNPALYAGYPASNFDPPKPDFYGLRQSIQMNVRMSTQTGPRWHLPKSFPIHFSRIIL